jgi:hypothetical protein
MTGALFLSAELLRRRSERLRSGAVLDELPEKEAMPAL